jgi:hypothetical protein
MIVEPRGATAIETTERSPEALVGQHLRSVLGGTRVANDDHIAQLLKGRCLECVARGYLPIVFNFEKPETKDFHRNRQTARGAVSVRYC